MPTQQQTSAGTNITIADVTLTNTGSSFDTNTGDLNPVVHDLVHLTLPTPDATNLIGVVNAFNAHNIHFMA